VRLQGRAPNGQGIGAKIKLQGGAVPVQTQEIACGGRTCPATIPCASSPRHFNEPHDARSHLAQRHAISPHQTSKPTASTKSKNRSHSRSSVVRRRKLDGPPGATNTDRRTSLFTDVFLLSSPTRMSIRRSTTWNASRSCPKCSAASGGSGLVRPRWRRLRRTH